MKLRQKLLLCFIFIFAGIIRLYGINWDHGFHMQPDERAIIIFTANLSFPFSLQNFLAINSPWNPHFFAYGSFPLYFLYWIGKFFNLFNPSFFNYDTLTFLGRGISAFADLATLITIFFIGKKLWSTTTGLLAAFFYSVSVLPIQLSHFYAVDTLLTFFITATLYLLILLYEKPTIKKSILIGCLLGLSFATKISALVIFFSFLISFSLDLLLIIIKKPHKPKLWAHHIPNYIKTTVYFASISLLCAAILFLVLEPYALLDKQEFIQQNLAQSAMTKSAFTFPYTLQYVFKTPYLYDLKQIFLIGLGPILSLICLLGLSTTLIQFIKNKGFRERRKEIIILSFLTIYFAIVGHFAVGFIRYMLPIYPILCLYGGFFIENIKSEKFKNKYFYIFLVTILLIWPASFLTIYTKPFTRYDASLWMIKNIPKGSTIAIEHWDDTLPLFDQDQYHFETLTLYDQESPIKWSSINNSLSKSGYIVLASNRLSTPLTKLGDCSHVPPEKCYKESSNYYKNLFSGRLGFKQVAQFTSPPHIPFTNIIFNDQSLDESFSVYDHPVVTIFKKTNL